MSSCRNNISRVKMKEFDLRELISYSLIDQETNIVVLETYEAANCINKTDRYANVYLCKIIDTADSIYLFEICKAMPEFAKDYKQNKRDIHLVLDKNQILTDFPNQIFVSNILNIKGKSKFMVGSLTRLIY